VSQNPLQQSASLLQAPPVAAQFGERQMAVKSINVQIFEQQFALVTQAPPMFVQTAGWQMLSPQVLEQQVPLLVQAPPRLVHGTERQTPSPQIPEQQSLLAAHAMPGSLHEAEPGWQTLFWQLPVQHWAELVHPSLTGRQAHLLLPLSLVTK
jgi:hypothetical protein